MTELSENFINGVYEGERALFNISNKSISYCTFQNGESPLKESSDLALYETSFKWKYPLWYCNNVDLKNCYMLDGARAGIWYTNNLKAKNLAVSAPKAFRRCDSLLLEDVSFYNAEETLWFCTNVTLKNVKVNGRYFGMGCKNIVADNIEIVDDYAFDGACNVVVKNSRILSKDAFWNTQDVVVENSYIVGEYLAWNAKNITFKNCIIESLQGLCYIDNLKLVGCRLENTTLSFEYSSDIDAEVINVIDSVKNPISGVIKAKGIKELILDKDKIDASKTRIITEAN